MLSKAFLKLMKNRWSGNLNFVHCSVVACGMLDGSRAGSSQASAEKASSIVAHNAGAFFGNLKEHSFLLLIGENLEFPRFTDECK